MRQAPEHVLLAPLKRKKPTTYFVNSMSDLFHENVPDEWIDRVFAVMALSPQHTFQVLTKRAARMQEYLTEPLRHNAIELAAEKIVRGPEHLGGKHVLPALPLKTVWLGVSTERQQEADERIPLLLQTPAAVRFISAEPLLGAIDLQFYIHAIHNAPEAALDWVIVGGESGHGARYMEPQWAADIKADCVAAGVSFFMKQMTGKKPIPPDLMLHEFPRSAPA
jgi:protein gp37